MDTVQEIEAAVKEVMGKDPVEMVIKYYEGLIQHSRNIIAEEQKTIRKLQKRIAEVNDLQLNDFQSQDKGQSKAPREGIGR